MRRVFSGLLLALLLFEIIGLFWNLLLRMEAIYPMNELPLANIQGIIVDENRILIGLGDYNVIQEYNSNGEHIKNWKIQSSNKGFIFWLDSDGIPKTSNKWIKKLRHTLTNKHFPNENLDTTQLLLLSKQWNHPEFFISEHGNKYAIRNQLFRKLYITTDSKPRVIIDQSLLLNIWCGLTRTWFYCSIIWFSFLFINLIPITRHVMKGEKISLIKGWKDIWHK